MTVNEKAKVIGLTGMSGSGKSTVCNIFRSEGFDIVDCDMICRKIVEKGRPCLAEIAEAFGQQVICADGSLDRTKTGNIIFSDESKRRRLNGIMYPYVSYIVIRSIIDTENSFIMIDAPTLFESGIYSLCDFIVSVVADREILLKRIQDRDLISEEQAEKRLSAQHDTDFFYKRSDYVIENNGNIDELLRKVMITIKLIKEGK